jgi:hypothetical protein
VLFFTVNQKRGQWDILALWNLKLQHGSIATAWDASPDDPEIITNLRYGYLTEAMAEDTTISGGLVQTNTIRLGTTVGGEFIPMAGSSGNYNSHKLGGGLAFWAGGDNQDMQDYNGEGAAFGIRQDGTAYAAKNTVRFNDTQMEVGDNVILDATGLHMTNTTNDDILVIANQPIDDAINSDNTEVIDLGDRFNQTTDLPNLTATLYGFGYIYDDSSDIVIGDGDNKPSLGDGLVAPDNVISTLSLDDDKDLTDSTETTEVDTEATETRDVSSTRLVMSEPTLSIDLPSLRDGAIIKGDITFSADFPKDSSGNTKCKFVTNPTFYIQLLSTGEDETILGEAEGSVRVEPVSKTSFYGSCNFRFAVDVAGDYILRLIFPDEAPSPYDFYIGKYDFSPNISVIGTATSQIDNCNIIGNNGIGFKWGNTKEVTQAGQKLIQVGDVGFKITINGVFISADGGETWSEIQTK